MEMLLIPFIFSDLRELCMKCLLLMATSFGFCMGL